jgi:plastocyanin
MFKLNALRYVRLGSIALFVSAFLAQATVADVRIKVIDKEGNAVADAVIIVPGREAKPNPDQLATMDQIDRQFDPLLLAVPKGQLVNFPNSDDIRHHVYSFSRPNQFEIKLYGGEPAAPLAFEYPGVVVLGCNIHDAMKGYIFVSDHHLTSVTNAEGSVELAIDESEALQIWHPRLSKAIAEPIDVSLTERDASGAWIVQLTLVKRDKKTGNSFRSRYK